MIKNRIYILSIMLLFLPSLLLSQIRDTREWKKYKYEVSLGLGVSSYMGDLGGNAKDALRYLGYGEFNSTLLMPVIQLGFRYKMLKRLAIKTNFAYSYIKANDANSGEKTKIIRNLSFRSPITEFSAQVEFSIIKERFSSMYQISTLRSLQLSSFNTYVFAGFGAFMFNPQAKYRNNESYEYEWYDLQTLGTEGQGIGDNSAKYSLLEFCIPAGIGIKVILSERASLGIEYGYRFTTTDYLDDASNMYYDNVIIAEEYGKTSAQLADRHLDESGKISEIKYPGKTLIRGNPDDKDAYMFLTINLVYRLKNDRRGRLTIF